MFELKSAIPEDVGMSSARLLKAKEYAQKGADQLGATGGAVVVIRHDRIAGEWYWGKRGPEVDSEPVDAKTLMPVASVTKGFTASALALLLQDGAIWLDDEASLYLPELVTDKQLLWFAKENAKIRVRHLATHSSGMPHGDITWYDTYLDCPPNRHPYDLYVEGALARLSHGLIFEPGTSHCYSDPAVCLLGEIIHRVSGQRVPDLLGERVFKPLGLERIGWDFPGDLAADIARSIAPSWRRRPADPKQGRYGSTWGGLITSARDLATFGLVLLHEGELGGVRVMAPLAVRMMSTCQMPMPARPQYPHRGLLWWIKADPETPELGHMVPYGTYCHGGATHCVLVMMPALDVVAVMLRTPCPHPPEINYNRDYPVFMDTVAAAVDQL